MKGMPKSRLKRILFRLHPKHLAAYWFSRDGAIMALKIGGISIVVGFFLLMALLAYFRKDLPNLKDISGSNIGGSIRYYDRTGTTLLWEDYDAVKRTPIADEDISPYLKAATVAVEDRDFLNHSGFNVKGIVRAAWNNAFGGSTQGGSTITQQLVKLTNEGFEDRTLVNKIRELILSVELERTYSKKEILDGYLNAAPYGGIEYGVEVAARTYFQKSAKDVTLDEATFLAAIPQSPRYLSPYSDDFDAERLVSRQHYILDVMVDMGTITKEMRDESKAIDTLVKIKQRQPKYTGILAPHFVLAAKRQVENQFGAQTYKRGGWSVTTTLDMDKQKIAEEEVAKGMKLVLRNRFDTAAFVAEDVKTGQVVALVGGADFADASRSGQINYAQQPLPPGSSFKPYDYLSLIENTDSFGAGAVLYDTQGALPGYPCTNKASSGGNCLHDYDKRYPGPLTLRYALGGSRNVPAVKAMLIAGVDKTIALADTLGLAGDDAGGARGYKCFSDEELSVETQCYGSSSIGDGAFLSLDRHVHAYATISRNGNKIPQTYIMKIEDSRKRIVDQWEPSNGEQVVRAESAYIVSDMMSDPKASYMSTKIHRYKNHKFSVKTGTTNDSKDGWLMGFSTQYSAGVWVGHHTRRVIANAFMESMTQPIWRGFMQRVHDSLPPEERPIPVGIQTLPAFVVTSHVGVGSVEPSPATDIFPSWYKKPTGSGNDKRIIDQVSGKLASECTPELAKKEIDDKDASNFSGDTFANSTNEEKDDVHKCDDIKPTADTLTALPTGLPGQYTINAYVASGTHPWSSDKFKGSVSFKINDQVVNTQEVTSNGIYSFTYQAAAEGLQTIIVEPTDSALYTGLNSQSYNFLLTYDNDQLMEWAMDLFAISRTAHTSDV